MLGTSPIPYGGQEIFLIRVEELSPIDSEAWETKILQGYFPWNASKRSLRTSIKETSIRNEQ
jgi:hypothetical protein